MGFTKQQKKGKKTALEYLTGSMWVTRGGVFKASSIQHGRFHGVDWAATGG
jgi:hypothetical protein